MKRLLSLFMCLLLLPVIASAEDGWIASAKLSDEEEQLLRLLNMDEGYGPYEFKAPEGANHIILTVLEFADGQWTEMLALSEELPKLSQQTSVTLTATQQEDGTWRTDVQQPRVGTDRPDGRIYIDGDALPDNIWLSILAAGNEYPANIRINTEEETDLTGLYCWYRTFLNPTKNGYLQEKAAAILNEPVLLELYVCTSDWNSGAPDLSAFNDPAVLADFDYAFAVTATFTDTTLPEDD